MAAYEVLSRSCFQVAGRISQPRKVHHPMGRNEEEEKIREDRSEVAKSGALGVSGVFGFVGPEKSCQHPRRIISSVLDDFPPLRHRASGMTRVRLDIPLLWPHPVSWHERAIARDANAPANAHAPSPPLATTPYRLCTRVRSGVSLDFGLSQPRQVPRWEGKAAMATMSNASWPCTKSSFSCPVLTHHVADSQNECATLSDPMEQGCTTCNPNPSKAFWSGYQP